MRFGHYAHNIIFFGNIKIVPKTNFVSISIDTLVGD